MSGQGVEIEAPTPDAGIVAALERLDKLADHVGQRLTVVEGRLEPILRGAENAASPATALQSVAGSHVAGQLADLERAFSRVGHRLLDLERRIDL